MSEIDAAHLPAVRTARAGARAAAWTAGAAPAAGDWLHIGLRSRRGRGGAVRCATGPDQCRGGHRFGGGSAVPKTTAELRGNRWGRIQRRSQLGGEGDVRAVELAAPESGPVFAVDHGVWYDEYEAAAGRHNRFTTGSRPRRTGWWRRCLRPGIERGVIEGFFSSALPGIGVGPAYSAS